MNMHTRDRPSCNTYFYTMGRRIGIDRFAAMAKRLGLGQKFDLPVVSQSYGTIPDRPGSSAATSQDWTQSDTLNAAIGQGYVILNPLQLAVMAARVASGRDIQPRLIRERQPAPAAAALRRGEHFETVRSRHGGGGQRRRHRRPQPAAASTTSRWRGKTGTAQVRRIIGGRARPSRRAWNYRDHGLFVFFAPVDAPRYAGAVVIEHGLGGARAAAPVAKDVLTYLFDKDKAMAALAAARAGLGRQHRRADGAARPSSGRTGRRARRRPRRCRPDGARLRPPADRRPALADAVDRRRDRRAAACSASIRRAGRLRLMPWALPHAVALRRLPRRWRSPCPTSSRSATSEFAFAAYGGVHPAADPGRWRSASVGGGARAGSTSASIRLQPSELMKPVLVLVLARFYAARAAARDQALVGDLAGGAADRLPDRC